MQHPVVESYTQVVKQNSQHSCNSSMTLLRYFVVDTCYQNLKSISTHLTFKSCEDPLILNISHVTAAPKIQSTLFVYWFNICLFRLWSRHPYSQRSNTYLITRINMWIIFFHPVSFLKLPMEPKCIQWGSYL